MCWEHVVGRLPARARWMRREEGGRGAACDDDAQCLSGSCKDAVCAAPDETPTASSGESKANWISLALQQDALFLPSVNEVCLHQDEYHCFNRMGRANPPMCLSPSWEPTSVEGPISPTTYWDQHVLADSFTVGIKAGYAFNGAPADFLPVHVEARATYWLPIGGVPPFSRAGLRPYIVLAGGIGQTDSSVKVTQHVDTNVFELLAWRKSGPGFAALGAGLSYAINPATAAFAEVKATQLLGSTGTGASLEIGFARGPQLGLQTRAARQSRGARQSTSQSEPRAALLRERDVVEVDVVQVPAQI